MRAYVIAAGLALSVMGNARGSVVDTGADAQKYCQSLVDGGFQDSGASRGAGSCEGMIETAMVFAPNMPADVRTCPGARQRRGKRQGAVAVPRQESGSTERGWNYACDRSPQRCLAVRGRRCRGAQHRIRAQTQKARGEKSQPKRPVQAPASVKSALTQRPSSLDDECVQFVAVRIAEVKRRTIRLKRGPGGPSDPTR